MWNWFYCNLPQWVCHGSAQLLPLHPIYLRCLQYPQCVLCFSSPSKTAFTGVCNSQKWGPFIFALCNYDLLILILQYECSRFGLETFLGTSHTPTCLNLNCSSHLTFVFHCSLRTHSSCIGLTSLKFRLVQVGAKIFICMHACVCVCVYVLSE